MTASPSSELEMDAKRHLFYQTSHSPSLADLVGYEAAKNIIDFCFIANPYYPTPEMLRDLQAKLPTLIKSYPSSNPRISQSQLATVLKVNPDNLLIGNGATELIALVSEQFIDRIAIPVPTFGEYLEKLRDTRNAELYSLDPARDYQLDLDAYWDWIQKRGLKTALVINPGNPTGQLMPLMAMEDFLKRAKDMDLIIVDESFIDFGGDPIPSLLPMADRYPNLFIVRSMSKHCGVPGLRLGYCYTPNRPLLDRIRHALPTWNINTLAEYFLSLLPSTDSEYHSARKQLIADVRSLYKSLQKIPGIHPYPTGANFVLVKIVDGRTARDLQQALLKEHRMYVRDCSNKVGMDVFHIRIASQGAEKDSQLVNAFKQLMAGGEHHG